MFKNWYSEDWIFAGATLFLFVILPICFVGFALGADYLECQNTADILDLEAQWRVFGGCFIEIEEAKWIPLGDYNFVQGVNP